MAFSGNEAFIAGKWYKVGDKIADAKIVTIGATKVEIEWDGKKTSFSPIGSTSARSAAGGRRTAEEGSRPGGGETARGQGGQGRSPGARDQ